MQTFQYSEFKDKDGGKSTLDTSTDAKEAVVKSKSNGKDGGKPSGSDKNIEIGPPKIDIRIIPATYPRYTYEEKNMMLGRELSPHLTIYKIQLTSFLSICLRISGFVLGVGIWIFGLSALFDVNLDDLAQRVEKCDCSDSIFKAIKFVLILPFAYHLVAGTRHLIWYLNVFLTMPHVYATGYAAIALTLLLATGLTCVTLDEMNKSPSKVSYDGVELQTPNLSDYIEEADKQSMMINAPENSYKKRNVETDSESND